MGTALASVGSGIDEAVEWICNAVKNAFHWIGNAFENAFQWIDDAVARLDLVEWALVGVGLLLLWRALVLLRAKSKLGPLTIADLKNPPDGGGANPPDGADGQRLAALMRERLASAGVPDVELPGGRPPFDLEAVVKSSPIPQATWVATVVTFVQALLRRFTGFGFRAEGTLQKRNGDNGCGITVALSRSATGELLKMRTFWANAFDQAVERAAFWLFVEVVDAEESRKLMTPSQHWSDPEALRLYHKGIELEADNTNEALEEYGKSAQREERNVLPQLAIANVCERLAADRTRAGDAEESAEARIPLLEALARYQGVAHFWPDQAEARYRLANLCSFRDTWERAWGDVPADDPQMKRLQVLIGQVDPPTAQNIVETLFQRSLEEYERLITALHENSPRFERMTRVARLQFERMTRVARLCTQLQLTEDFVSHASEVEAILDEGGVDWNTKYNAACFYTLAIQYADDATTPDYADRALELLDQVLQDPASSLPVNWVTHEDPDLQPLRDWLAKPLASDGSLDRRRAAWTAVFSNTP